MEMEYDTFITDCGSTLCTYGQQKNVINYRFCFNILLYDIEDFSTM